MTAAVLPTRLLCFLKPFSFIRAGSLNPEAEPKGEITLDAFGGSWFSVLVNELELAGTFANIVGLICNFVQGHQASEAANREEFVKWLYFHQHGEIAELIARSISLQREIDNLLRKNHEQLLKALNSATAMIATVLSRLEEFTGIARTIFPNANLSNQAMFFLHQLANSEVEQMIFLESSGGFIFSSGDGVSYIQGQQRFIRDDLETLARLGFFRSEENSQGHDVFELTRGGLVFLKASKWTPAQLEKE